MVLGHHISRRRFLILTAMAGAAAGLGLSCRPPPPSPAVPLRGRAQGPCHLAWAWKFAVDGPPEQVASVLAQHNLGIILKTHTGTQWMSTQDTSPYAVTGPVQVAVLADYFESYGIPFHTYCVLHGVDPVREAEMCADVASAGARSVIVDLEPYDGYWRGTPEGAIAFGQEFRRRQPGGVLHLCVEPRPWQLSRVPAAEFASFSQAVVPMVYWESFNTAENVRLFQQHGFPPGPEGVTPEFLLDVTQSVLGGYGLPIIPIGQGASTIEKWKRFVVRASQLGMSSVSAWRYGVTNPDVWMLLKYCKPAGLTW
ncbi:MAG: twin-arginine translocation signal domain-containing protein [Dehalococcoidia bacterium]|nr:twin-arginine translocation signal domain-containing protein [Dehalococcoidia bacterium]